jgi:hypothetical protein
LVEKACQLKYESNKPKNISLMALVETDTINSTEYKNTERMLKQAREQIKNPDLLKNTQSTSSLDTQSTSSLDTQSTSSLDTQSTMQGIDLLRNQDYLKNIQIINVKDFIKEVRQDLFEEQTTKRSEYFARQYDKMCDEVLKEKKRPIERTKDNNYMY